MPFKTFPIYLAIMTAHIVYKAIDNIPTTLSKDVIENFS